MTKYALLLRGINVGGNKKIAMADLRELLSGLGFTDVRTLLQSGNAVFDGPSDRPVELVGQIETEIKDRLGLTVRCLLRTASELQSVIDGHPFREVATEGSKMLALFLSVAPDPILLAAHDPTTLAPLDIVLGDRVIYQWCPDGILASPAVGVFAERYLRVAVTARNWNTVLKLNTLLGG